MRASYDNSYRPKFLFSSQNILLASIAWAVLALLYFLLFSVKISGADGIPRSAAWYVIGTNNILAAIAYLSAGILCLRNWRSPHVSGQNVWLTINIGMLCYFLGGKFFGYTKIVLKEKPIVSLGDVFFVVTYLFCSAGKILAVASSRLNLEKWQWMIVLAIKAFGSAMAWLSHQPEAAVKVQKQMLAWAAGEYQINFEYGLHCQGRATVNYRHHASSSLLGQTSFSVLAKNCRRSVFALNCRYVVSIRYKLNCQLSNWRDTRGILGNEWGFIWHGCS